MKWINFYKHIEQLLIKSQTLRHTPILQGIQHLGIYIYKTIYVTLSTAAWDISGMGFSLFLGGLLLGFVAQKSLTKEHGYVWHFLNDQIQHFIGNVFDLIGTSLFL